MGLSSNAKLADTIKSLEDHVRYYGSGENTQYAKFLLASSKKTNLSVAPRLEDSTPQALMNAILEVLGREIDCVAIDVTSPDLREENLAVVKVLSPQLIPLGVGWRERYVGNPRIYMPRHNQSNELGRLSFDNLNPHPHPFP